MVIPNDASMKFIRVEFFYSLLNMAVTGLTNHTITISFMIWLGTLAESLDPLKTEKFRKVNNFQYFVGSILQLGTR